MNKKKQNDNITNAFLALVRAGLWEENVQLLEYGDINYKEIYRLAEEQTVVGLVAAGLEHVSDSIVPKEDKLLFVGHTLQLEQRNKVMNGFIAQLFRELECRRVYPVLVKGQGIAQCYERPLWRTSGDVDLFLCDSNYKKAVSFLTSIATQIGEEEKDKKHIPFTIKNWEVELHGTLRCGLGKRAESVIEEVQDAIFHKGKVRTWLNGTIQIPLPKEDEDTILVFSHILQHFFTEGIGLRQICDWCRLLCKYNDTLDCDLLESRIRKMGLLSEWKAFASLAVNTLGMPEKMMPLYSPEPKWKRKAQRVFEFVLKTGNFGKNRDASYRDKYSYLVFKMISLFRHTNDTITRFLIFPLDAFKSWWLMMREGIRFVFIGK